MNNNIWDEVARQVAEYDAQRPRIIKEYRLYYNPDGTIIGLWESGHPEGDNYVVLDNPGVFYHANTLLLRVHDKKLKILDPHAPLKTRLKRSTQGFPVVQGHAAVIVEQDETYSKIEYYDRTNN
jgi:hypothetical protein